MSKAAIAPEQETSAVDRITVLDFLRGVAILGMLVANVPWLARDSMSRVHDADVSSVSAWLLQYLVFDQRFLPIFCMLFGASLYLLSSKAENAPGFNAYFLKRMFILLLFGVAHAYLLWPGDILITYAVCGPMLLLFRRMDAVKLILIGIAFKSVNLVIGQWPVVYEMTLERLLFSWWVDYGEAPSSITAAYAGSYADLFSYNAWRNQFIQWTGLPYFRIWNALGFMLIGMGLFKLGILQGKKDTRFYRRMMWLGFAVSLPLILYGIAARIGINETVGPYLGFTAQLQFRSITFLIGCAIGSFGVVGLLHLIHRHVPPHMLRPFEAVGRMALSNYTFHSLLFLLIFHVFELLPFDRLDHDAMLGLVVMTWALQIPLSMAWLSHFQQGPLEALWRRLSGRFSARTADAGARA